MEVNIAGVIHGLIALFFLVHFTLVLNFSMPLEYAEMRHSAAAFASEIVEKVDSCA